MAKLVAMVKDLGLTPEAVVGQLKKQYHLTEEAAQEKVKRYWAE